MFPKNTWYVACMAHEIDDKAVSAKLEDGILKLTLPKRSDTGARPIAIE